MATVREETYALLRALGMTTVFGNPGSTEEPFLNQFPDDFTYVLGLQEASAVAMADGYAQATGRPALVNLHTAPGVGNAMGNIIAAQYNKTPLIITAGQQVRAAFGTDYLLVNRNAAELPKPHVKWSIEAGRAQDVPRVFAQAYYIANQAPQGPVFVSIPMDDWDEDGEPAPTRMVSTRMAPDPAALARVADALAEAKSPALVAGAGVDRSPGAWEATIALAQRTHAAVFGAPWSGRAGFPENHAQFQGFLPFSQKAVAEMLKPFDVVVVLGAPAFVYYPYVPGPVVDKGTRLFQITDDPGEAARAADGDSVVGDVGLAVTALLETVSASDRPLPKPRPAPEAPPAQTPMTAAFVFHTLSQTLPPDTIIAEESPSNMKAFHAHWPVSRPGSYYTGASGGLGWSLPAAVGIKLADPARPVAAIIGDGSAQYSVQALWTAAQHRLPIVFLILRNTEYAILKSFGEFEKVKNLPGMDLPGLDSVTIAQGYGCAAQRIENPEELAGAVRTALAANGPTVLEVLITTEVPPLL